MSEDIETRDVPERFAQTIPKKDLESQVDLWEWVPCTVGLIQAVRNANNKTGKGITYAREDTTFLYTAYQAASTIIPLAYCCSQFLGQ